MFSARLPTRCAAWLGALLVAGAVGSALAQQPNPKPGPEAPQPPVQAASEPAAALPSDSAASASPADDSQKDVSGVPKRIQQTLDSMQDFLDALLIDALGPDPKRRYRVFGQRRTVDLGKRWTLALDERPVGRLNSAGVGIPAAGLPARTWELTHDGRYNSLRAYNQNDGSGRENGGSLVTTFSPMLAWHTQGLKLHDESVNVARTDVQTGLRVGSPELWVEGFVRHTRLEDPDSRENWVDRKPRANFGGVQTQWEMLPGLTLNAQHQRAIKSDMAPGDERLAGPRTDFGADYRPGGRWSGSRVYWREAPELGLLSSAGVEERTTYHRVIGVEVPEGSPDGLVYSQIRHESLLDKRDALLVVGWRHTEDFAPKWRAQTLIESGIPVGGDNAVRSNTFDLRIINNEFPHHALATELQAVRTPIKDSAFFSADYTRKLSDSFLSVARAGINASRPKDIPGDVPLNSADVSFGLGWQEPDERRLSTFWRYNFLGREALIANVVTPGFSDRRAHIVSAETNWQSSDDWSWRWREARRVDHDESINASAARGSNLHFLRATNQIAKRWSLAAHYAHFTDTIVPSQRGFGTEISVQLNHKIVLALAYNPRGVDDAEIGGDERIGKGVKLRLYIPTEAALKHWLKPAARSKDAD